MEELAVKSKVAE